MQPKIFKATQAKPLNSMFAAIAARLIAPQKSVIEVFCTSVAEVMQVKLDTRFVSYVPSSKTIHLNAPGMFKQEIKMREKEIFEIMKATIGAKNVPKTIL
ncbi:hypothetical protein A3C89_02310 [Candidatus Kaiserbacteria bacterium RIFCSPHIGHO2_02_FULL_50_50]|uniref:Uncharacterized protein n=1 Tax=Candidatus Kaiserbacteria bacterium RIFCSPHIGHO2_02_FULL_50_50 TaxID=1798492 RepID=A0A1F6DFJ5_9BACT|nr:MAG: hypothetical protein A3C89_02310 [Candidatus Kaiserbacteria bacterium RIFCSPHIGHO2_02_FULL_50_50]OGG88630.1 MAG: hypothetical protein A3G62_00855 [Candidatus Kaiserbacteria bacterium RIFCSPLOWO2_12_FULL_50_10]